RRQRQRAATAARQPRPWTRAAPGQRACRRRRDHDAAGGRDRSPDGLRACGMTKSLIALVLAGAHDRLVRELAVGARAAVAFVEYTPSPEARYPVAIEQGYAARWIGREGASRDLEAGRMAVAGDSVGGNMTAALTLMAKQRGDVHFVHQSLYYP